MEQCPKAAAAATGVTRSPVRFRGAANRSRRQPETGGQSNHLGPFRLTCKLRLERVDRTPDPCIFLLNSRSVPPGLDRVIVETDKLPDCRLARSTFPDPAAPPRVDSPSACGSRHIATASDRTGPAPLLVRIASPPACLAFLRNTPYPGSS